MIRLHSNPISRENKDGGLHQPNPMFLTRTIKMSKPTVNGRLIGPEISGGIDGIGCPGRVERERLWVLGHPHFGIVTVVWNSFSGAEGRDSDRLIEIPRRRAGQKHQSTEDSCSHYQDQHPTRLGWLPLSRPPD